MLPQDEVYTSPNRVSVPSGVSPTQLHRFGSLGSIDLAAVLLPLDFLLPQREPEIHVTSPLRSLSFEDLTPDPGPTGGPGETGADEDLSLK